MALPNWVNDVLRGGLPAALDYGDQPNNADGNTRPEKSPPNDNTGRDNANPPGNFLPSLTQVQLTSIVVLALSVGGIIYLARK